MIDRPSATADFAFDGPSSPIALRLRSLGKRYGNVAALHEPDLNVRQGEVYGFPGRNGAGKSTALRIAMGITRTTSGSVELFGRAVAHGDPEPKRSIGYVAQEQSYYEWMTATTPGRFVSGFYSTWDAGEYFGVEFETAAPPFFERWRGGSRES